MSAASSQRSGVTALAAILVLVGVVAIVATLATAGSTDPLRLAAGIVVGIALAVGGAVLIRHARRAPDA